MARAAGKKSRQRSKAREEPAYYVVELSDWDWSFMFGVSNVRNIDHGPYSDYRHLHLYGKLLRPANLKTGSVEVTLLPNPELNEGRREKHEPRIIGSLSLHHEKLDALLSMPADALTDVLQMLIAGRFRYVVLDGTKLRYRQGEVRSIRLEMKMEEDDLPHED